MDVVTDFFMSTKHLSLAFAHDTNIAVKDKKINLTDTMNTELEKINDWWYIANKLTLHFDKSAILFSK